MKIYKKIILILLLIMGLAIIISNISMAIKDTEYYNPGKITQEDTGKVTEMTGTILATIRNVGIIVSVISLTIIGLKWMFGSVEEKANYKENIIPYIVGCFLIVCVTTIPDIVYHIVGQETSYSTSCPDCGKAQESEYGPFMCPDCGTVW